MAFKKFGFGKIVEKANDLVELLKKKKQILKQEEEQDKNIKEREVKDERKNSKNK
jgi:hypothetical protein